MAEGQLHIRQVRSAIGVKPKQRGTLRALGLGRIGRTVVLPDRPEIRGMVANVVHLVRVENDGAPVKAGPVGRRCREMKVHDLAPAPGSTKARRRVGRGIAGKGGKTAGRGTKGAGARDNPKPGFEGGQLPLTQRVPKLKGFKNPFRVEYTIVNLDALERLSSPRVDPASLREAGLVHKRGLVKVLGVGQVTRPMDVSAHALFGYGQFGH